MLSEGARSIEEMVGLGKKRLKLAEAALEVLIFSDDSTTPEERAAFYAEMRSDIRERRLAARYLQRKQIIHANGPDSGPSGTVVVVHGGLLVARGKEKVWGHSLYSNTRSSPY
jgi:hypothetical protein